MFQQTWYWGAFIKQKPCESWNNDPRRNEAAQWISIILVMPFKTGTILLDYRTALCPRTIAWSSLCTKDSSKKVLAKSIQYHPIILQTKILQKSFGEISKHPWNISTTDEGPRLKWSIPESRDAPTLEVLPAVGSTFFTCKYQHGMLKEHHGNSEFLGMKRIAILELLNGSSN